MGRRGRVRTCESERGVGAVTGFMAHFLEASQRLPLFPTHASLPPHARQRLAAEKRPNRAFSSGHVLPAPGIYALRTVTSLCNVLRPIYCTPPDGVCVAPYIVSLFYHMVGERVCSVLPSCVRASAHFALGRWPG
jgi:hypothetical protein